MTIITGLALTLAIAVTVEGLTEYAKTLYKSFAEKDFGTLVTLGIALVASIALCALAGADVYAMLGISFGYAAIGQVLTGIFASRGANYIADLVKKLQEGIV